MTQASDLNLKSLAGKRILVVDDMEDNQILESHYLKRAGAHVDLASNGVEAVEKALQGDHDAVLMDLHMPLLDGLHATARLRREGYGKPIIAITADTEKEVKDRAFALGFTEYLSKPLSRFDLLKALGRFCCANSSAPSLKAELTSTEGEKLH
jgi:hypothetical protein